MNVDAITITALADEFEECLLDGRVQAIVQTGHDSLGFEIYASHQRHYLFMTIDPQAARCHLVTDRLRRGVDAPSPLYLQLRKYVAGARLVGISQPAWERILHFDFSGAEGEFRLIVELMGRRSNIILTAEGEIFECVRRVGPGQNRYRVILPGKSYVPPPPLDKPTPDQVTPAFLADILAGGGEAPAWRALVDGIGGVSPLLAREIVYRCREDAQAPAFDVSADVLYLALASIVNDARSGHWSPCVVPSGEGYRAFAPYSLTHVGESQSIESISAALALYFGAQVGEDTYAEARALVRRQLDAALDRAERKSASLERQSVSAEEIETIRKQGELIYAYAPTLLPSQSAFEAQYDPDGPPLTVELDPLLTPAENARRYFERYEKAKRAGADIPALQTTARRESEYLRQLATDLQRAQAWPEIDVVREALQEAGYWQGSRTRSPRGGKPGLRRFEVDGFVILVGRNAAQNHVLLTERSGPDDLWLHARELPGSHVIVKHDGRAIPESVINRAAELAAYYSAGRADTSVEVVITERRHVRPIKGGRPGMVTFKNERTVVVKPERDL